MWSCQALIVAEHSLKPTALDLAVEAMNAAADRLARVGGDDPDGAYVATGECLWWFGVVRQQLWDRYQSVYNAVLDEHAKGFVDIRENARMRVFGLWHVRDRMAHEVDIITYVEPHDSITGDPRGYHTSWRWLHLPPPTKNDSFTDKKYEAYEAVLAGQDVHDTLVRALSLVREIHQRATA